MLHKAPWINATLVPMLTAAHAVPTITMSQITTLAQKKHTVVNTSNVDNKIVCEPLSMYIVALCPLGVDNNL